MAVEIIPKNEWSRFLKNFSMQHEGWLVTLQIVQPSANPQIEAHEVAFSGITIEPSAGHQRELSILLNSPGGLTHRIPRPKAIELRETDSGAHESLAVRSEDGTATVIRFRSMVLPEQVDGLLS